MALFTLDSLRGFRWRELLLGLAASTVGAALLYAYHYGYDNSIIDWDPMIPLAIAFTLCFVAGLPIALVLGLAGLSFILGSGSVPLAAAPVSFTTGISSFILLAIPFFMLAGALPESQNAANSPDPYLGADGIRAAGAEAFELDQLLREADVVSAHVLLTEETRHFFSPGSSSS